MIACLPGLPVATKYVRASFAAVSIDSPPPEVKKIFAPSNGSRDATRAASSSVFGDVNPSYFLYYASVRICSAAASASSARP